MAASVGTPGVVEEELRRRGGRALHAVDHDHVGAGLGRELDVVEDAAGAHLHEDRDLVAGRLAQLLDLDAHVVGPDEVGVARRGALVDARREVADARRSVGGDLGAEQHAARARLRALADRELDGVGLAQVMDVVAVAARGHLVDELFDAARSRRCMPPSPVVVDVPTATRRPAQRHLRVRRERAEAHAGDQIGVSRSNRPRTRRRAEDGPRLAPLAVALERDAGEGARDERQVVEARRRAGSVQTHPMT